MGHGDRYYLTRHSVRRTSADRTLHVNARANRRYNASFPLFFSTCGTCTPGHFVTRIDRPGSIFCDKFLFVVATAPALIIHEVGIARSDRADSCGERILARRTTACVCGGREARPRNLRVIALLDKLGSPVLFLPPLRLKTADRRVSSVFIRRFRALSRPTPHREDTATSHTHSRARRADTFIAASSARCAVATRRATCINHAHAI